MAKLLCHLLMKVNHVMIANFYVANMSFNAIRENKILAKISEFTVTSNILMSVQHERYWLKVDIDHKYLSKVIALYNKYNKFSVLTTTRSRAKI